MQNVSEVRNITEVSVERINNTAVFAGLSQEWDELLMRTGSVSPFLTWEWLYSWWQHLSGDRDLYLVTVRLIGGRLVGIAPFCRRYEPTKRWLGPNAHRARTIEFLGADLVGSDYLDIIADPEWRTVVTGRTIDFLLDHRSDWDFLELTELVEDGHTLGQIESRFFADTRFEVANQFGECCPYLRLKGSFEGYVATLGSGLRRDLVRQSKHLFERSDVEFEDSWPTEKIPLVLSAIIRLHRMRRDEKGGSEAFEAGRDEFHHMVAALFHEKGWLSLSLLRQNGRPIAGLYGFEIAGTFYYYQSGFDPKWSPVSIGTVLVGRCIKNAYEKGLSKFDFLRGDEDYKWRWTQSSRETRRLLIWPTSRRHPSITSWPGRLVSQAVRQLSGSAG